MDPILEAMYADTCPTPPPPEAGAIPEPTENDRQMWHLEQDYAMFAREGNKGRTAPLVCSLIRRLAASERDRDDARRRVEDMIELRNAIRQLHAVSIPPQDISGRRMWYESWRTLDAFLAQSAPGTGGTTGGGE
jgi:sugar phosphate isomerase/epimerase